MNTIRRHTPILPLAGVLILLIAAVAVVSLWLLVHLYEGAARSSSTLSALQYGIRMTRGLAEQPFVAQPFAGAQDSGPFDKVVDALQILEPGMEYVSVSEGGAVLYHQQSSIVSGLSTGTEAFIRRTAPVSVGRKKLMIGTNLLPIVTFTRQALPDQGRERELQVAFRKDVLEREHAGTASALTTMFTISLLTIIVAFGLCLVAIIGLVRRELTWQRRQRFNEHLAFAGAMAGSIIHDFRNPMSAMRLDAQLLQHEAAKGAATRPERLVELADRITQTIDRVDALLAEFLILANPDTAVQERFDINPSVADCVDLVKLRFAKAEITLLLSLAPSPLAVKGYPMQFKRALLNILANAEQFTPSGSTVSIQTRLEHKTALVLVTDAGPGIAPADQAHVFDIFFSRRPGGTGIGLALAKAAIENCGGTIDLQPPASGKGSCFIIRIPTNA